METSPCPIRFGAFELNLKTGELSRGNQKSLLQEQPFQILCMLIEHRGDLVTREEIRRRLWPNDTVVEFDRSINSAVKRLRQALGDPAESPEYIETIASRGYRLIMKIETPEHNEEKHDCGTGDTKNNPTPRYAEADAFVTVGGLTGRKFSHYRVLEIIGGGGMGVVYKAEDIKLGRRVAVKFLPEELSQDRRALARFQREARAASALNHPNICTIYAIEEQAGHTFIVMELLQGETLGQRLMRGCVAIPELTEVAIQIAEGLEAAHAQGIIHRDIKPANIFLTQRGQSKILDFGLAILQGKETDLGRGAPDEGTQAAIVNFPLSSHTTVEGALTSRSVGTAAYMSPEQIRGESLDSRTDLFSLGAVLYEMATGHRASDRNTLPAPKLPPQLSEIVYKALEDDRRARYETAAKLRADLQCMRSAANLGAETRHRTISKSSRVSVIALLALTAVVLAFAVNRVRVTDKQREIPHTPEITRLNVNENAAGGISPDGKLVGYVQTVDGQQSVWLKRLDDESRVQIAAPARKTYTAPVFAPDGSSLYYSTPNDGGIVYQLPTSTGKPVEILAGVLETVAPSPDGRLLAFRKSVLGKTGSPNDTVLVIADASGGSARTILSVHEPEFLTVDPDWSQDGRTLFSAIHGVGMNIRLIAVDTRDGRVQRVGESSWSRLLALTCLRNGKGLVVNGAQTGNSGHDQIWGVAYPEGGVQEITRDTARYLGVSTTADSTVILSTQFVNKSALWIAQKEDLSEAARIASFATGLQEGGSSVEWTIDGRILYDARQGADTNIWIMNSDGGQPRQFTAISGDSAFPSACGDSRHIVFQNNDGNQMSIWRVDADGNNPSRLTGDQVAKSPSCAPDGAWIAYAVGPFQTPIHTIWRTTINGGRPQQITTADSYSPSVSPDGKWIACAYFADPQGPPQLAIFPSKGGPPAKMFELREASTFPKFFRIRWNSDGQSLTYGTFNGNLWTQSLEGGPPTQLTHFDSDFVSYFAWSKDGKLLAINRASPPLADLVLIRNFRFPHDLRSALDF